MKFPQENYIVDSDGTKTAVILSIKQYEQLPLKLCLCLTYDKSN